MKPIVGRLTVALGVVHTLATIPAIAAAAPFVLGNGVIGGVASSVPPGAESMPALAALFSTVMGGLLLLLGGVVHRLEVAGEPLPGWLGPSFIITGIACGLLIPPTGFWLVAALGVFITVRARRG